LPVLEGDVVLGVVNILKLTYATLELIRSIDSSSGNNMWRSFWDSTAMIPAGTESETYSETHFSGLTPRHPVDPLVHLSPSKSFASPRDVYPHDSVSATDITPFPQSPYVKAGPEVFMFKFKTPANKIHKFSSSTKSIDELRQQILARLQLDGTANPFETLRKASLCYLDEETDQVMLSSDKDLDDAVQLACRHNWQRITISMQLPTEVTKHRKSEPEKKPEPVPIAVSVAPASVSKSVKVSSVEIPEQYIVPGAVLGGFVGALLVMTMVLKLRK